MHRAVFIVNHNIRETLNFLSTILPATITIKEQIQNQPLKTLGNPSQINQVLINLCTNAKHAMEGQKGMLEIDLEHVEIDRSALYKGHPIDKGRYAVLSVKDTGHGIDPAVINHIFDSFFTTKPKEEGTGLGLAMVHKIVKDHGGQVLVESQREKGSVFHVLLPLYEGSEDRVVQSQKVIPKGISTINTVNKQILIVDDEQDLTNVWQAMLEEIGYEVTSKTNGADALKAFSSQPDWFDLVLTDNNMPHMCGDELAGSILKIRNDMPIIFCSGTINEKVQEKFKNRSNVLFLRKSVTIEFLNNKIRQLTDDGVEANLPAALQAES